MCGVPLNRNWPGSVLGPERHPGAESSFSCPQRMQWDDRLSSAVARGPKDGRGGRSGGGQGVDSIWSFS